MGCGSMFLDVQYARDKDVVKIMTATQESSDNTIKKLGFFRSSKNLEIIKKIKEENDKVAPLLKRKIDELIKKGNEAKPIEIGKGKCGRTCYAYNEKIIFNCPKCNGQVNWNRENGFTTQQQFNERTGRYEDVEILNETKICTRFDFNKNIDKIDVDINEFFKYFEKVDKEKTVHWSMEYEEEPSKNTVQIEQDMPIHYMMIDGERYDFPYGIHMKEFFLLNNSTFFFYDDNNFYLKMATKEQLMRQKIVDRGEIFVLFFDDKKEEMGQSCGYYGYAWLHVVYIYECNECKHKYHVIKTSPFANRDKSKDPK